jgi:sulfur relay protein TusB/DsrH
MIVVVKSGPDTTDGRRGVTMARSEGAVLVLIQNAVAFAHSEVSGSAGPGATYVLENDLRLRGMGAEDLDERIVRIGYPEFVDLITAADKVVGAF